MTIHLKAFLVHTLLMAAAVLVTTPAFSQAVISIGIAPPQLQEYSQPPCPEDGYIWTPGYWAYDGGGYVWVPGQWVQPPQFGLLWTPPYWGWNGGAYDFHSGYWGSSVGYYGGINYGYGYGGNGYRGGRWEGQHFSYNTAVNNIGAGRVHSSYADRAAINNHASRVSFNGGKGGVQAQPNAKQRQMASQHGQPIAARQTPSRNPQVATPGSTENFSGHEVKAAKQAPQEMPAPRTFESQPAAVKPQKTQAETFQNHTSAAEKPQPRPETQAKPQSHPVEHAQAETHSQPQGQAPSQDHGDKPQGR